MFVFLDFLQIMFLRVFNNHQVSFMESLKFFTTKHQILRGSFNKLFEKKYKSVLFFLRDKALIDIQRER